MRCAPCRSLKVENTVIKAIKDHLADTESLRGAFDEFMKSQTTDGPDPAEELGNLKAAMKRKIRNVSGWLMQWRQEC